MCRESKTVLCEHTGRGKDCVFKFTNDSTSPVFDVMSSGGAKWGSSTNGNQGRHFFERKLLRSSNVVLVRNTLAMRCSFII